MDPRGLAAFCIAVLIAGVTSGCEKSHEEKAKDWLDIGEFDAARYELSLAIQKNPKNAEARVLIAATFMKQSQAAGGGAAGLVGNALAALAEADRVEGRENKSAQVRLEAYERLAAVARSGGGAGALEVIRRYPSPSASPILEYLMGEKDDVAATAAEDLLRGVDAERAKRRLVGLLEGPDPAVRERAAARLWERDRDERARPILRARLLRDLPGMTNQAAAAAAVRRLVELGYAEVADALLDVVRKGLAGNGKMEAALAAFDALVAKREPRAAEIARSVIAFKSVKEATDSGCTASTRPFVQALGTLRSAESFNALKEALSYVMVNGNSRFGGCLQAYFDALAQNDAGAWRGIKFWYDRGGWPIFLTMIPGRIESARRGEEGAYASQGWQLFGRDAAVARERLTAMLQRLGRYSVFAGGRQIWYAPQRLSFENPGKVRFLVHLHDMGRSNEIMPKAAGYFTLVLESVGSNAEQPWVITAVEEGYLDGQVLF